MFHPVMPPRTPVKVKICGLTAIEDALAAVSAGADAIGLVFYEPSPRHVSLETAAAIARELPEGVLRVGLFVNAPVALVARAASACGLTFLQFHGDESPEVCLRLGSHLGVKTMKAFRVRDASTLTLLPAYQTDAWLLDAYTPGKFGGSGQRFDWDLAVQAAGLGKPIFLAGGLTPETVAAAVRHVRPYAVDVSSGVELAPGKKDIQKVRAFIQAAKNVD
jgi:phosphoribosylanthranilate isomerase